MDLDGDKGRTVLAMVVARAWKDSAYKRRLQEKPEEVFKDEGISVPAGVQIKVLEDVPGVKYLSLSRHLDPKKDANKIQALFARVLPIPEGNELRLAQSTETTRYVVIPRPPRHIDLSTAAERDLILTAAGGVEATFHDTTQTTEAETTEVTVTETTEVQDAETSTTVVAEAELVAT
jgi:hypothetical protein